MNINEKLIKVYANFNLGASLDTSSANDLQMSEFYFSDQNRAGFTGGFSYDILQCFGDKIYDMNNAKLRNENKAAYYYSSNFFFQYKYNIWNIKNLPDSAYLPLDVKGDTTIYFQKVLPKVEASSFIIGLSGNYHCISSNYFSFGVSGYLKSMDIVKGSENTFNYLFLKIITINSYHI